MFRLSWRKRCQNVKLLATDLIPISHCCTLPVHYQVLTCWHIHHVYIVTVHMLATHQCTVNSTDCLFFYANDVFSSIFSK